MYVCSPPPSAYFFLMLVFVLKKVNLYFIGVYVVCVRIKQDVINFGYIGLLEEDYEWITQQLVQVANRYIRIYANRSIFTCFGRRTTGIYVFSD